ncbi:MAG: glycosyltransferase family 4 protein [Verrucomicrobiae bacterium]|nr:glycosyltransferase family 4 protein [Verrucomicrobiae bacterium]
MSRILVLCYECPPLGGGGGRVAIQVASALVKRGHQVRFVTAGMPHLPDSSLIDGVEVIRVRSRRRREDTCSIFEMMLWIMRVVPVTLKESCCWRPHVIHVHFAVPTGVVAWIIHQFTRIPYVLTAHLGDVPGGVPQQTDHLFKLIKPLTVPIWASAAHVTSVSSFVAKLAQKAYGIMPTVILNGVNLPSRQVHLSSSMTRLLFVGRFSIQKNPLFAIQALSLIRELPWILNMVGEGPLFAAAQDEVRSLSLEDKIHFSGWLASDEIQKIMEQSDVLLIPSLSEGLPMVGVEALAEGLAILGSRIGGLQDIIDEGQNGCFFDLDQGPSGMANAIQSLIEDLSHLDNMKKVSLRKAQDFQWSRSIDAYEKILESCKKV